MSLDEIIFLMMMLGGFIVAIYMIFFRKSGGDSFRPFIPQPIKKTFKDEISKKISTHGVDGRGYVLYLGNVKIGKIIKFLEIKTKDFVAEFNEASKYITVDEKSETDYDLIIFKVINSPIYLRIFGIGLNYYIFNANENTPEKTVQQMYHIDHSGRRFIFPYYMDLVSYGDIWINGEAPREYLHSVSIKRMLENTQMYLENYPDKTVHLENETARRERISRTLMDLEKNRYEESRQTGDTVIN